MTTIVVEIATFDITPGAEDAFIASYESVRGLIAQSPGCLGMRMMRGIESPTRFVLTVEWESLEAHTVDFRESEGFGQWRAAIGPHFASPPAVEHVVDVEPSEQPAPRHR